MGSGGLGKIRASPSHTIKKIPYFEGHSRCEGVGPCDLSHGRYRHTDAVDGDHVVLAVCVWVGTFERLRLQQRRVVAACRCSLSPGSVALSGAVGTDMQWARVGLGPA